MIPNIRLDKSFKNLAAFSENILVCCPHCSKKATVVAKLGQYTVPYPTDEYVIKFSCQNCYKPIDEKLWYGPILLFPKNSRCKHCGSTLKNDKKLVNENFSVLKTACNFCKKEDLYETKYELTYANSNQATDPYFGISLWLQLPFDNYIFWAYNYQHLSYLKDYVGAKLREAVNGGKYSLVWKLPNFIKIAKNREGILKVISKLEKM